MSKIRRDFAVERVPANASNTKSTGFEIFCISVLHQCKTLLFRSQHTPPTISQQMVPVNYLVNSNLWNINKDVRKPRVTTFNIVNTYKLYTPEHLISW